MIARGQHGQGHKVLLETTDPIPCREDIIGLVSMIVLRVISKSDSVNIRDLGKVAQTLAFSNSASLHASAEEAVLSR